MASNALSTSAKFTSAELRSSGECDCKEISPGRPASPNPAAARKRLSSSAGARCTASYCIVTVRRPLLFPKSARLSALCLSTTRPSAYLSSSVGEMCKRVRWSSPKLRHSYLSPATACLTALLRTQFTTVTFCPFAASVESTGGTASQRSGPSTRGNTATARQDSGCLRPQRSSHTSLAHVSGSPLHWNARFHAPVASERSYRHLQPLRMSDTVPSTVARFVSAEHEPAKSKKVVTLADATR